RRLKGARLPTPVRPPGDGRARRHAARAPHDLHRRRERRGGARPRLGRLRGGARRRIPGARLSAALGRRPLHPLYGWHHGPAEGGRLAPRRRLHGARRRHRPDDRGARAVPGIHGREGQGGRTHHVPAHRAAHARRHAVAGDAMARPLIEALAAPDARWNLASLRLLTSSAATFSPAVKDQFFQRFPDLVMIDAVGSSESGNNGMVIVQPVATAMRGGPPVSRIGTTAVLDEAGRPIPPGSGKIGKIARSGDIPLEYYKDPMKTAETFITVDGVRWAMPGDWATVEADGRITLLGRGSVSIDTGGEKVFPEEVEAAVKSHPAVFDCTVVGVPDARWGERVTAVVELRPGAQVTLEELQAHCRARIAGYKI